MPRFGFETLYAPPQLDHCMSWEGRQFVAHFANPEKQWNLDHSDFCFSFLQYDMATHAGPDATVHMLDSPKNFHSMLNVGSFFSMCEPLASQLWNL